MALFREKIKNMWFLSKTLGPEPNRTIVSHGMTVIGTFSRELSVEDQGQLALIVAYLNKKDKSNA